MATEYFEVVINETGRNFLKQERPHSFNTVKEKCKTIEEVKKFLVDRYGKMPKGRNKIYVDGVNKNEQIEVGFLHSYWNRDCSHGGKSWYQTDWISVYKMKREAVNILTQQLDLTL